MLIFEIPRWSQDGSRLSNSLKMAPKLTQNEFENQCFWDNFSINYAMLSYISSITNKWSNTNQLMPTSTKKTHSIQRGVGGMRRRPGNFLMPFEFAVPAHQHHVTCRSVNAWSIANAGAQINTSKYWPNKTFEIEKQLLFLANVCCRNRLWQNSSPALPNSSKVN